MPVFQKTSLVAAFVGTLVGTVLLGACGSGASAVRCDDGSICPEPGVCLPNGGCEIPGPASFCEVNGDGAACTDEDDNEGECRSDQCVAFVCPDGVVDANEVCDGPVGPGTCVDLGFDFGTPGCESCAGPSSVRCGFVGWDRLSNKGLVTNALYAVGDEAWLGGLEPRYYDGLNLVEEPTSPSFSAVDGSSRDNIWSFAIGSLFRFDGSVWSPGAGITNLETQTAAIATVSVDEAYVGGRDSSTNSPTIWAYDGGADSWSITHSLDSGAPYDVMAHVGQTIFAVSGTTLSIKDTSGWRDVPVNAGVRNMWARAADDLYIATENGGVFHFDGSEMTLVSPIRSANVGGLGGLTYIVGATEMLAHRAGTPFSQLQRLESEGSFGSFGNAIVDLYSTNDRIVANFSHAIFRFNGSGFLDAPIPGAAEDISVTGDSVYWISEDNGRLLNVIDDAFSDSPIIRAPVVVTEQIQKLWARGTDDVFAIAPGRVIVHWDGVDTTTAFMSASVALLDIDGDGTTAMAVGRNRAALLESDVWQDIALPSNTNELSGVFATGGEFVAVGDGGAIAIYRNGAWVELESPTSTDLLAVDGVSSSNFWAVGSAGTIVHCQDVGGSMSCEVEGPNSTRFFSDVAVASATDVLVTSGSEEGPSAMHYDGLAWSPVNLGPVGAAVVSGDAIWLGDDDAETGFMRRLDRIVPWDTTRN